MSKRKFRQLERDYHAMLNRYLTIDLNDPQYDRVAGEFRAVRDQYEAARKGAE